MPLPLGKGIGHQQQTSVCLEPQTHFPHQILWNWSSEEICFQNTPPLQAYLVASSWSEILPIHVLLSQGLIFTYLSPPCHAWPLFSVHFTADCSGQWNKLTTVWVKFHSLSPFWTFQQNTTYPCLERTITRATRYSRASMWAACPRRCWAVESPF